MTCKANVIFKQPIAYQLISHIALPHLPVARKNFDPVAITTAAQPDLLE
ncbi:hypothetical protein N836_28260 [Leptolyngbya sp. Heron Island J]|nr:hypothetical protein N836_28260 [Leptolyngbya sp. Heron Island J]